LYKIVTNEWRQVGSNICSDTDRFL